MNPWTRDLIAVHGVDGQNIRITVENGSACYRLVERCNEYITLWEGLD